MHVDDTRLWICQHLERHGGATADDLVGRLRAAFGCDPFATRLLLDEMVVDARLDRRIDAVAATDGHADLRYVTWFFLATERAGAAVCPDRPVVGAVPRGGDRARSPA